MVALHTKRTWGLYQEKTTFVLEIVTFFLSTITLLTALVNNNLSMKLYNITAIICLLTLIIRWKNDNYSWRYFILPLSIFTIGLIDFLWYSFFKTDNSPFRATYHNYLNTAKIFTFGAFIILLALTSKIRIMKEHLLYIIYSLSFIIFSYAAYIKSSATIDRIDFGIGTATGAAYSIMMIGLVSAVSILYTKKSHPFLFIINAIVIFVALAFTETRSTMLIFPLLCMTTLVVFYKRSLKKLAFSLVGFFILLSFLIFIFIKPITTRYNEALHDITEYNNNNSVTSVGARLAMYEVGTLIFKENPFSARSVEDRAGHINKLASEDSQLRGSLPFINVHLHNEIIEAASLKGVAGILSILFFYLAMLYTAYYLKSLGLFIFSLAIIATGLTDVIIWARSIPIIITTGMALLLILKKNKSY